MAGPYAGRILDRRAWPFTSGEESVPVVSVLPRSPKFYFVSGYGNEIGTYVPNEDFFSGLHEGIGATKHGSTSVLREDSSSSSTSSSSSSSMRPFRHEESDKDSTPLAAGIVLSEGEHDQAQRATNCLPAPTARSSSPQKPTLAYGYGKPKHKNTVAVPPVDPVEAYLQIKFKGQWKKKM